MEAIKENLRLNVKVFPVKAGANNTFSFLRESRSIAERVILLINSPANPNIRRGFQRRSPISKTSFSVVTQP